MRKSDTIDPENLIRERLYGGEVSVWRRYAQLVNGNTSIWNLIKYELIIFLFGPIPGALGLALRGVFYPLLFKEVGRGAVFGRNLVVRHASQITIGARTLLDDEVLIDAHGGGPDGIVLGDEVVVNRDVLLIAKSGPIRIGSKSDVGARAMVISTGGIRIGSSVALAGDCKIGGSAIRLEGDPLDREKTTDGPVEIEDGCTVFTNAIVLDGVRVGRGSVVGAGVIVRDDIPEQTILAAHQKLVRLGRGTKADRRKTEEERRFQADEPATDRRASIVNAVFAAIDEVNLMSASSTALGKSLDTELTEVDSMDLVNLVVETEQRLSTSLGIEVNLSSSGVLGGDDDVPWTLSAFVDRIEALLSGS